MTIRRANNQDIFRINELLCQVLTLHYEGRPDIFKKGTKKYTDKELEVMISNDQNPIFVAQSESGEVVGYAFTKFIQIKNDNILTDIKTLYIDDLCVDKKCRGKGVGKSLFNYVKEFAVKNSCYNLTLNVWACNDSAIKFYQKCGLIPQKTMLETIL